MYCCHCKYLDESNKKEGKLCGAEYYCKLRKRYVNGNSRCVDFDKEYGRKISKVEEICHDGDYYSDDNTEPSTYFIILIVMIIMIIFLKLFN